MTDLPTTSAWLQPFIDRVNAHQRQGGFILSLTEYRPDLARHVAHELDVRFFDYRADVMAKLGWDAHTVSLPDLDQTLEEQSSKSGLVAFNVEALLGTKPEAERSQWLMKCLQMQFVHPVIVPLCVFNHESLTSQPRYHAVPSDLLPQQSFLNRLAM